ncbi:MAG: c-type cytochrome [Phycisphaerales bacterium]|nr:c-type cytochrome [Phycisphaerales bacterium]
MKTINLSTVFLLFSLFFANPGVAEDDVTAGARVYNENCSRCHNARPVQEFHADEWSVIVPHMREKAHLSGTEAKQLEAFIAVTLTADKVSQVADEQTEDIDGPALVQKFACAACHKMNGTGGALGPSLDDVVQRMGREDVIKKILEPTFNNPSSSMPRFPLSEAEAAAITDTFK